MKKIFMLLLAFITVLLFLYGCTAQKETEQLSTPESTETEAFDITTDMLTVDTDVVCGMKLTNQVVSDTIIYQHQMYGFCGDDCKAKFKADPEKILANYEGNQ
jgi:YHS domain-containing protein